MSTKELLFTVCISFICASIFTWRNTNQSNKYIVKISDIIKTYLLRNICDAHGCFFQKLLCGRNAN